MKLRFDRQEMADALRAICSVAASRTPKTILKCVRLEARGDMLLLSATDLELGIRYAVTQVEVDEPGETLVVADTLLRIVSECTDEVLGIEMGENLLHIRGEGSHFQIVTQDPSEFPPVPEMEGEPDFTIERGVLLHLIEWTVFAAARESTRYAINGVLWEVEGDKLTLAATDGRRLSLAHGALSTAASSAVPRVIVPGKALSLFSRLGGDSAAPVGVKTASNQLLMSVGPASISTSLVEGHFPKYQDVVPGDCDRIIEVNLPANLEMDLEVSKPDTVVVIYASTGADIQIPTRQLMTAGLVLEFMPLYTVAADKLATAVSQVESALAEGALTMPPVRYFELDDIVSAHETQEAGAPARLLIRL